MLWRNLVRPLFFSLNAESAHYTAMGGFRTACQIPGVRRALHAIHHVDDPALNCPLWGLNFPNPVGLAAGFDKGARWFNELAALGFGHIEVGTITAHAQPGNPTPRLFRLPEDQA
ncbi:MAG: quinone-dependent dihydroorotate dehydrogenase, partial [Pirellulaceae bacterium]|nr:quinone-dependent dihydroorotate dehydrogenase [Pirellulaceae bacterium]